MKRFRVLFLAVIFICSYLGTAFSESYQNITFQKNQSYELVDVLTTFAPPEGSKELDWIGISYAENFQNLYKTNDVPKSKEQFVFGGYIGLIFNNNGWKSSTQYWEDGLLKEKVTETGVTSILSFYCPVWNGYNHLNIGINLPPNKISYLLTNSSSGKFENILMKYFSAHNIHIDLIEEYTNKYYETKYLYKVTIPEKSSIYLIIDSWSGSGGQLGHVNLDLYLNSKTAKNELIRAK